MPSVADIIQSGGLLLIAIIIFAESGMFVGFFFPGDTLLLTAGVFAAQGKLSLTGVILVVALAAIIGDNTGYFIGRRYGRNLFSRSEDSLFFRREYADKAEFFFKRFGNKAMLLAHFVPIVRTFAPPVAGIGDMPRRRFVIYDAIGDIAWAASVTLIGYWFGTRIPDLDHYILLAVVVVMIITLGPSLYHLHKAMRRKSARKKTARNPDDGQG
jgi:membrane-associated protein